MANKFADNTIIHNYSYDLDAGDVLYFQLSNVISSQIIEVQFLEDSEVIIYDCINDYTTVKTTFANAVQSELDALNWQAWTLGTIDQDSGDKRLVGNSPSAFKVNNSGAGQVRINFKGLRG
jgi:hypothetical protein